MPNTQEKQKDNTVHLLYKNLGETPLQCIERFKKANPEYDNIKMTYAGRLDPMAEGLLIILSGEEVKHKQEFLDLPKTYVCQILWGFETDTLDILGRVIKCESVKAKPCTELCSGTGVPSKSEIQKILKKLIGKFTQGYPVYSSKPVLGKPLFQWVREGRIVEVRIPKHEVEILNAKFIFRKSISGLDLLADISSKISLVVGDFRQEEINKKWKDVLSENLKKEFIIDQIELTVSSGFYVRQFVSDMSAKLGTVATTFHIMRNRVGEFVVKN